MIENGLIGSFSVEVTDSNTAIAMKSSDMRVFATPALVAAMEAASVNAVEKSLEKDETTVGSNINISHISPTIVGGRVLAKAELVSVEGKKLTFQVSAFDESGIIGEGNHTRYIVNRERFMNKAIKRSEENVD